MSEQAWILIPAHNRRDLTLGCLAALRAHGDLTLARGVVIDDGSTDDTGAAVRREFPEVRVLAGDGSLFWTGAIARAMNEAQREEVRGPMIWLNDDCRPRAGALQSLIALLTRQPEALAAPLCVDARTGAVVATGFIGRKTFAPAPHAQIAVRGLSGFCVGVGVAAWRRLGPPDHVTFPHYGGDTAYTLRASREGLPVLLDGNAVVELIDHDAAAGTIAGRIPRQASLPQTWRRLFAATNSPFRLRTMFALQQLKYGPVLGTAFALARTAQWHAELSRRLFLR